MKFLILFLFLFFMTGCGKSPESLTAALDCTEIAGTYIGHPGYTEEHLTIGASCQGKREWCGETFVATKEVDGSISLFVTYAGVNTSQWGGTCMKLGKTTCIPDFEGHQYGCRLPGTYDSTQTTQMDKQ